ncbi:MAG: hypothetical protein V3575_06515 [Candidatus Absconditabacteria bacterium]
MTEIKIELNENSEINQVRSKIIEKLKVKGLFEGYGGVVVNKIKDEVYSVEGDTGNISYFANKTGEVIISTVGVMNSYYFKTASILTGYFEIKGEDGTYRLYKIKEIDRDNNKIIPEKEVDKYSEEYYNARMDIAFFGISMSTKLFLKKSTDGLYNELDNEWLGVALNTKVLKILDLYTFYNNKQITKELFDKYLSKLQSLLLQQIADSRFERVKRQITKEELDFYLNENLISKELYDLAIQELKELEDLKQQKEEKKKNGMKKALEETMNEILGSE